MNRIGPVHGAGNGVPKMAAAAARKSILNRNTPFGAAERTAFIARIMEVYEKAQRLSSIQSVVEYRAGLLRAEARAVLAVGRKADRENIQRCRRETLEKLGASEERQNYIELLLDLASTYCTQNEYSEAREIHTAILALDPGNWHSLTGIALAEAAQGNGAQALEYFEKAAAALPAYPYEVSGEEQQSTTKKIIVALFDGKAPLEIIASLVGKVFPLEEREVLPEAPSLGPLPHALWLAAARMAESAYEPRQIEQCFGAIEEGLGAKLVGAYLILRMEAVLHEKKAQGEKEAKALQRTAQKLVTIEGFSAECKAILQHELAEVEKDLEKEAAAKEMRVLLGKIEKEKGNAGAELRKLIIRFATVYKKAGPEDARASGRQAIGRIMGEILARPVNILVGAIISTYIYGIDRELDRILESCFEKALEDKTIRRAVTDVLRRTREVADKVAEAEIGRKMLELPREVKSGIYTSKKEYVAIVGSVCRGGAADIEEVFERLEKHDCIASRAYPPAYDFFAVCLKRMPAVREIFAEISGNALVEPVRLNSYWRQRLGERAQSVFHLAKAIEADSSNTMAWLAWSRLLQSEGKLDEAGQAIGADFADIPLVRMRASALQIEGKIVRAERLVEAEAEGKTPPQLIALGARPQEEIAAIATEAREGFSRVEAARLEIGAIIRFLEYPYKDWVESALKLAHLHYLIYDYTAATGYYDQILILDQDNKEALFGKGSLLVLQGKYVEAEKLISEAIIRKGTEAGLHIFYNEIMCARGGQQLSRKNYEQCLSISPEDPRFLLAQAQLLACLDEMEEAKTLFAKAQAIHKKNPNKEDGSEFLGPREAFVQYTAATIQTRGGDSGAVDGHRKVLRYFKRHPFWSAQIRFNISRRMMEQPQGFERGFAEAARLFRSAPFDPSHNSLVVAPLVRSGEDRLALNCINYLVDRLEHTGHIHAAPIMDLICLTFREKEVSAEAARTFLWLAEYYRDEELAPKWRLVMQLIKDQLEKLIPGFMEKLPTEVAAILQA